MFVFLETVKRYFIKILKFRAEKYKSLLATFVSGNFVDTEAHVISRTKDYETNF